MRSLRFLSVAFLLAFLGCGPSQARIDEAKASVQEGLEVWKKGGKPAELLALAKPIEFHEGRWREGAKLVSFEMGKAEYHRGEKVIRCEAVLTLLARNGKKRTEAATYEVKLESPIKVTNNPMP